MTQGFNRRPRWQGRMLALATALGLVALLSACGGSSSGNTSTGSSSSSSKKVTVAFLLPENLTYRWENQDAPYFKTALQKYYPNANVIVDNAGADASTQQSQAEAALANGAKVLVVAPVDSAAAAVIVNDAKQDNVPVIAYDRLIENAPSLNYYVSFDGFKVGQQQGQYVAQHTPKGGTVVVINGAETDANGVLFHSGYMSVLTPLFNNGTLKKGYESWTPNWDPANAQREMEQALTVLHNNVQAVLSANDGMATTIIAALQAQGLAGKVVVTGQDATVAGLQKILEGTQSMTVYKPLKQEADAAAQITAALLKGQNPTTTLSSLFNGRTTNNGATSVPSVLLQPEVVTKSNIESTVIKDGFVTQQQLCQGVPSSDCPSPGY
jgi:D-xylose transport system substrate-binding protein